MEAVATVRGTRLRFEDFYRAEFPHVFRTVMGTLGDADAAKDVTQEAFKRAYVRWRRLSKQPWAGGWVTTTALNLSRRHAASMRSSRLADTSNTAVKDDPALRVDVSRALRQLPIRQRQVVVLFYIRDIPVPAIAEVMGISEGTVKAHLNQGRIALRNLLEVDHG